MGNSINWKQFLVTLLGTAIGVGLTLFVNGVRDSHRKDRAQRLTAIMVIHDIDNTVELVKGLKEAEEKSNKLLQSVLKRRDSLDTFPYDTLRLAMEYLVKSDEAYRFDLSKEKIFNSDLDTWQNLGSMKFIDNIQSFFFDRQSLEDALNKKAEFSEPIPYDEYNDIFQRTGWITEAGFVEIIRPILKEKLSDQKVFYYLNLSSYRIGVYNYYINLWTQQNHENKFLMGLTDKELEDYINSISNSGIALRPSKLVGHWEYALEDENSYEYDFHSDKTYDMEFHYSNLIHSPDWSGRLKYTVSYKGTWSIQADSLIMNQDFSDMDMQFDLSGLEVEENMRDSLESWANGSREQTLKYYTEHQDENKRSAYKALLDATHDKMEWSIDKRTIYLNRHRQ